MENRRPLLEMTAPPIPMVHIGIIGLGHRGQKAVERYALVPGAEIVALADHRPDNLLTANRLLHDSNRPAAREYLGNSAHRLLLNDKDVDLVYICTEWGNHAQLALMAMAAGKHVAVEVPAAMSISECEMIIQASLHNRRHCMMLENCVYDTFASSVREMANRGLLGDITHCEGAYIHDLSDEVSDRGGLRHYWMARETLARTGNAYPTHAMGSIAFLQSLHRGDRMDSLVSMTSRGLGLHGRVSNTLIHTIEGRTLLLQHDIGTPRPYSRLQTVCGTHGFAQKYPTPTLHLKDMTATLEGDEALGLAATFREQGVAQWFDDGRSKHSPNVMNHVMDCRLIHCLNNGLPLDMDVFDAAEWSAIIELSSLSVSEGSRPVPFPDFTRGNWRTLSRHRFY